MSDILDLGAREIARAVVAKKTSALEVAEGALARAPPRDGAVGAYLAIVDDVAREQARRVDAALTRGASLPLAGVPVAIKDNMCLTGTRTTAGSKILGNWVASYTATAVQRLLDAGAIPVGKANLDEFAMGSSCENSALGVTRNPWDLSRVPGGSSGGSVAAVASGQATFAPRRGHGGPGGGSSARVAPGTAPFAPGSATGASIRDPAAFCGVVGFKPTYGRV